MASNDPGLAQLAANAEDPTKGAIDQGKDGALVEEERPVAPDQFDDKYTTSKWEIWAWYSYYIGNNGLTLFNFAPTAAQNLVYQQAVQAGGPNNDSLYFAGANRTINSIILLCNGISFAIQIVVFLVLGSYADFGTFRPNILIVLSIIAWGLGFGWLGVHTADKWQIGLGMYVVGLIAYQLCLTYWTAAFPGLARNTLELRDKAREFEAGEISREQYDFADSMKRNELSNVAFYIQSMGEIVILAVIVGIMFGVNVNASQANNNWGLSVLIAFATGIWLLLAIPWFILEKRRPGQDPGMNIVLAGFWQLRRAVTQIWQLKQSLAYLIGYFLLGDSLNTTVTVIATLQNEIVAYNTLQLTYLLIVGIAAQALGIFTYWNIQKRYRLSTKTMFNVVAVGIIILDGWGMIGCWTSKFGFKNAWEEISEVTPRGKEFLFFSLFSIVGKTSSFIGPLVSSAIIDAAGGDPNANSTPFYFLFALSCVSFIFLLFFVDVKKSRIEQEEFLERERVAKKKVAGGSSKSF
ncbi:hypothetical protein LTR37_011348 [Vermiconidia calcicola]|uniref:Uncharacterized protein n=1 Tax=Vermiconidia calcicola TaxID=1690605 RepID=A0ACC3N298_9PEZI|nr:hypothetical protein LTR37_011348 [Vermiconidia calcicola]